MFPDIPETEWRWPHFSRDEMACRGTGECRVDPDFLDLLEKIRYEFGRPMKVTSGYRSPEYNAKVAKTGATGPHTTGRAVDIAVAGKDAYSLLKLALAHGIRGIGVSQKGPGRYLHLDNVESDARPMIWSY